MPGEVNIEDLKETPENPPEPEEGIVAKPAKKVIFVNHAGQYENATIISLSPNGEIAHLNIKGGHVNDKYQRQNVSYSKLKNQNTWHNLND